MAQCKCGAINEYQEEPYTCRDCRDRDPLACVGSLDPPFARPPDEYVYREAEYRGPSIASVLNDRPVCWAPDLDAIAAKEREILALVVDGKSDRDIFTGRRPDEFIRLRDELLVLKTDPAEIAAVRALSARIRRDQKELNERMKTMPKSIRDEVYGR